MLTLSFRWRKRLGANRTGKALDLEAVDVNDCDVALVFREDVQRIDIADKDTRSMQAIDCLQNGDGHVGQLHAGPMQKFAQQ